MTVGQGAFEIRTFIAVAAGGSRAGNDSIFAADPIFTVSCTVGTMEVA